MTATLSWSTEPVGAALLRVADRGVRTRPWRLPADVDPDLWEPASPCSGPTLYIVEPDAPAPSWWSELDDWIRLPVEPHEIYARADRLLERARERGVLPVFVDDDDILHIDDVLTVLTELEARLLRPLLAHRKEVVRRDDLIMATWRGDPPDDPRALDRRVTDLRRVLASGPLRVKTVRGHGYLLDWEPT